MHCDTPTHNRGANLGSLHTHHTRHTTHTKRRPIPQPAPPTNRRIPPKPRHTSQATDKGHKADHRHAKPPPASDKIDARHAEPTDEHHTTAQKPRAQTGHASQARISQSTQPIAGLTNTPNHNIRLICHSACTPDGAAKGCGARSCSGSPEWVAAVPVTPRLYL